MEKKVKTDKMSWINKDEKNRRTIFELEIVVPDCSNINLVALVRNFNYFFDKF